MAYPFRIFEHEELKRISTHKYNCVDNSIMQRYVYKSLFKFIQKAIPSSVTPNQITMIGFLAMLLSFILTFILDRNFTRKNNYLPLFNLILLLVYFICDGVDGVHARATNQCSPLGQLLDHGVDSCVCLFVSVSLASSLGIGASKILLVFMINLFFIFYSGILHEKFVGYFKFGYISGCSEGLTGVFIIHFLSFYFPRITEFLGGNFSILGFVITKRVIFTVLYSMLFINIFDILISVFSVLKVSRYFEFMKSIYIVSLLCLLLIIGFNTGAKADINKVWYVMFVFSNSFTCCYVEETLSMVLKTEYDVKVIVASFTLLLATIFMSSGVYKTSYSKIHVVLFISILHFLIRHGSIIHNLCKKLDLNFLSKN